jgi:septum formation protein
MNHPPFVYLASQSPRRLQLLQQWGVRCELLLPAADEDAEALEVVLPGESPRHYVQRVTHLKLQAALARMGRRGLPVAPVLCADTTVALGRTILGKPASADDACARLASLSGRRHRVLTAVAVGLPGGCANAGPTQWSALSESWVTFAELSERAIRAYVDTGEPMGKAGAYAIQGLAALWVPRIQGSYSGIMGLPAFETASVLRSAGVELVGHDHGT